ncbi:MAG: BAR domain-containing protein [Thermoplasmatota archaeon]
MNRAALRVFLVLALLAPLALPAHAASGGSANVGGVTVTTFYSAKGSSAALVNATAGSDVVLHVTLAANATRLVNASFANLDPGIVLANTSAWNATLNGTPVTRTFAAHVASNATGSVVVTLHLEVNDAKRFPVGSGDVKVPLDIATFAPPPVPKPTAPFAVPKLVYDVLAAIVVVVVLVVAVRAIQKGREARKPVPRSSALALDRVEKVEGPRSEEIKAEIEAREAVRQETRERQILEAKVADARKGIDVLRARLERGQINQFQFDKMSAKKAEELAKLEEELRRENGTAS